MQKHEKKKKKRKKEKENKIKEKKKNQYFKFRNSLCNLSIESEYSRIFSSYECRRLGSYYINMCIYKKTHELIELNR